MKTRLLICLLLLFVSACSGVPGMTPTERSTSEPTQQPINVPTSLIVNTSEPTRSATVPTQKQVSPDADRCTPALMPAGFFPDGERLLGFREDQLLVYSLESYTVEAQMKLPRRVIKAAVSPDGQTIAVGLEDFSILLINAADLKVIHTLTAHHGIISGLAFSPAGDRLLSASEDTWVRTWTLDGLEVDAFQPTGADDFPSAVMGIGISSDWTRLATIPVDGLMNLWSLPDHTLLGSFEGAIHGGYSGSQAAFSPDGQYLAQHLGAGGGYLSLWRVDTGELLLQGENITTGVDFSPDGQYLAYGEMLPTGGGHIVLRTPDGSRQIFELMGPSGSMPANPIFSPDSKLIVAGDYVFNNLLAWSTADGELISFGEVNCTDP
jgi:WD40 repeat protein